MRDSFFDPCLGVCTLVAMVTTLLSHNWKRISRSKAFSKEIATAIMMGFLAFMMTGYALVLGFALNSIITEGLHQPDSIAFLNGLLLYYFVFEFIMRYMIQNVPVLDIQPYLHLPVRRSNIMHFLLVKSLAHVLNLLVIFLFAPFAFMVVAKQSGSAAAWSWIGSLILLSLSIHYLVILFKKKLDDTLWGILSIILLFSFLGAADYYRWFKLSDVSARAFGSISAYPSIVAGVMLLLGILYFFNYRFFLTGVYTDEMVIRKSVSRKAQDFAFLQSLGNMGDWINLELKLILRNKRPRTVLIMTSIFLLYGLFFYSNKVYTESMPGFLLFVGTLIVGMFMMNYGQFLYSWQASHFDFTLTRPISLRQFIESKYWLLNTITFICFLLSIPYAYFGWNIVLIHAVMALFNMGISVFIILNMAMWGPKKINLTKGGSFNYEGLGAAQWVMGLPILLSPYVFYLPFSLAGYPSMGLLAIGLTGLVGIALRPYLLTLTTKRLQRLKYSIAAGFRSES